MGCDSQYKDAVQLFIEQIDVTKRLAAKYPNDLQFVTDVAGILRHIMHILRHTGVPNILNKFKENSVCIRK